MDYLTQKYLLMSTGLSEPEAIAKIDADTAALQVEPVIDKAAVIAKLKEEKNEWEQAVGKTWSQDKCTEMCVLIDKEIAALSK